MPDLALPFDESLIPADEPILAAVSGGADSMALLLALVRKDHRVVVAHVHHGTRESESDDDENFVRAKCDSLHIPFASRRVKVEKPGEAALRDARYDALEAMARESNCRFIATGHTADDALETILLQMLRGATVEGLGAFATWRALGELTLVRPLWQATREETRSACGEANWTWREDSSNTDAKYLRNRVRSEVLPNLGVLCRGGSAQLAKQTARGAALLRDEFAFLDEQAQAQLQILTLRNETHLLILDGIRFRALHIALQRRVLRIGAARLAGEFYALSSEHIEAVRRHVAANQKRKVWTWPRASNAMLRVEWTGAMAGNRIRLRRVDDVPQQSPQEAP